jgi:hypothetical protein
MLAVNPSNDIPAMQELAVWFVAIILVAAGFRYAKEVIAFVLDKFYEYFVLKNSAAV